MKIVHLIILLLLGAGACVNSGPATGSRSQNEKGQTLTIFTAASLADAFAQIGDAFTAQRSGATILLNVAGSQQLVQQIVQGAPGDVFASADALHMDVVVSEELTAAPPRNFAGNRLAVALAPGNPAAVLNLHDLARPGVRLVLADANVPAGRYARLFLEQAAADERYGSEFRQSVLANVASNEQNVRTVLTKVTLGEADAGLVYTSDLEHSDLARIAIPSSLNVDAIYPIAPLRASNSPDLAADFIDFVLSPAGQEILAANGFLTLPER